MQLTQRMQKEFRCFGITRKGRECQTPAVKGEKGAGGTADDTEGLAEPRHLGELIALFQRQTNESLKFN